MEELTGHIDIATYFGAVVGWVGLRGEAPPNGWMVELTRGDVTLKDVPLGRPTEDAANGGTKRIEFRACLPPKEICLQEEVLLCAVSDDARRILARKEIATLAGAIDLIDVDGTVLGWAFCHDEAIAAVELWIGGDCVCTLLADRYYPDFSTGRVAFVGFRGKLPSADFHSAHSVVSLRHRRSGRTLFESPIGDLRVAQQAISRGKLPIDAVAPNGIDAIYDSEAIEYFYNHFGPRAFVEVAYCYILERPSDPIGVGEFIERLSTGGARPKDVLSEMFYSEERRNKGGFLGPFVDEPGYPFALPAGAARSRPAERALVAQGNRAKIRGMIGDVAKLAAERDALEAECARLAATTQAIKLSLADNVKPAAAASSKLPPRLDPNSRLMFRWGGFSLLRQKRLGRAARRAASLADRARDARDWEAASRHYRTALDYAPADAAIWVQYGHALKEQGHFQNAESAYRQALSLDPSVPDTHLQLAGVLKMEGKLEEAAVSYLQSIALDPLSHRATIDLLGLGWTSEEIIASLSRARDARAPRGGQGGDDRAAPGLASQASPDLARLAGSPTESQLRDQLFPVMPVECLPMMQVGSIAERVDGVVEAKSSMSGHVVYGPYVRLPPGKYRVNVSLDIAEPSGGVEPAQMIAMLEAASGDSYLAQRDITFRECGAGEHELSFALAAAPDQSEPAPIEVRVWTSGAAPLAVSSVKIQRVSASQD